MDARLVGDGDAGVGSPVVTMRGVRKLYGSVEALRGIDLDVRPGELLAMLGPNGAGKTTAINIMLGLRRATEGEVRLFGGDPRDWRCRLRVGATPQNIGFPGELKVREVLELVRAHYPRPMTAEEAMARFGLEDVAGRRTSALSGGQRRRLAVALAFVGNPEVVFLDEPTTGLDVESRRSLWDATREFVSQGRTVVLTTHYLEEAEALASRVVVINEGKVVAEGRVDEIKAIVGVRRVRFEAPSLPALPEVVSVHQEGCTYTVYTKDSDALVRALVASGVSFANLEVLAVSLEEAFIAITEGSR